MIRRARHRRRHLDDDLRKPENLRHAGQIEIAAIPDDPVVADFLGTYAYMPREGAPRWILCGDNARFYNHSDTPNTVGDEWISHAATALLAGTELTIDYRCFDRRPLEFWL